MPKGLPAQVSPEQRERNRKLLMRGLDIIRKLKDGKIKRSQLTKDDWEALRVVGAGQQVGKLTERNVGAPPPQEVERRKKAKKGSHANPVKDSYLGFEYAPEAVEAVKTIPRAAAGGLLNIIGDTLTTGQTILNQPEESLADMLYSRIKAPMEQGFLQGAGMEWSPSQAQQVQPLEPNAQAGHWAHTLAEDIFHGPAVGTGPVYPGSREEFVRGHKEGAYQFGSFIGEVAGMAPILGGVAGAAKFAIPTLGEEALANITMQSISLRKLKPIGRLAAVAEGKIPPAGFRQFMAKQGARTLWGGIHGAEFGARYDVARQAVGGKEYDPMQTLATAGGFALFEAGARTAGGPIADIDQILIGKRKMKADARFLSEIRAAGDAMEPDAAKARRAMKVAKAPQVFDETALNATAEQLRGEKNLGTYQPAVATARGQYNRALMNESLGDDARLAALDDWEAQLMRARTEGNFEVTPQLEEIANLRGKHIKTPVKVTIVDARGGKVPVKHTVKINAALANKSRAALAGKEFSLLDDPDNAIVDWEGIPLPLDTRNAIEGRLKAALGQTAELPQQKGRIAKVENLFAYDEKGHELINLAKYDSHRASISQIADATIGRIAGTLDALVDFVATIPSTKAEAAERNIDLVPEVGRRIAAAIGKPLENVLVKREFTGKQHKLAKESKARRINVKGAYTVAQEWRGKLAGKRILLYDDIKTTGATAKEAAKALEAEGAEVTVVTTFGGGKVPSIEGAATRPVSPKTPVQPPTPETAPQAPATPAVAVEKPVVAPAPQAPLRTEGKDLGTVSDKPGIAEELNLSEAQAEIAYKATLEKAGITPEEYEVMREEVLADIKETALEAAAEAQPEAPYRAQFEEPATATRASNEAVNEAYYAAKASLKALMKDLPKRVTLGRPQLKLVEKALKAVERGKVMDSAQALGGILRDVKLRALIPEGFIDAKLESAMEIIRKDQARQAEAKSYTEKLNEIVKDEGGYMDLAAFNKAYEWGREQWEGLATNARRKLGEVVSQDILKSYDDTVTKRWNYMGGFPDKIAKGVSNPVSNVVENIFREEHVATPSRVAAVCYERKAAVYKPLWEFQRETRRFADKKARAEMVKRIQRQFHGLDLVDDIITRRARGTVDVPANEAEIANAFLGITNTDTIPMPELQAALAARYKQMHPVAQQMFDIRRAENESIATALWRAGFRVDLSNPGYVRHDTLVYSGAYDKHTNPQYRALGSKEDIALDIERLDMEHYRYAEYMLRRIAFDGKVSAATNVYRNMGENIANGRMPLSAEAEAVKEDLLKDGFSEEIADAQAKAHMQEFVDAKLAPRLKELEQQWSAGNPVEGKRAFSYKTKGGKTIVYVLHFRNIGRRVDIGSMGERGDKGIDALEAVARFAGDFMGRDIEAYYRLNGKLKGQDIHKGVTQGNAIQLDVIPKQVHDFLMWNGVPRHIAKVLDFWRVPTKAWKKAVIASRLGPYNFQNFGDITLAATVLGWPRAIIAPLKPRAWVPAYYEAAKQRGVDLRTAKWFESMFGRVLDDTLPRWKQANDLEVVDRGTLFTGEYEEMTAFRYGTKFLFDDIVRGLFDFGVVPLEQARRFGIWMDLLDATTRTKRPLKLENTWMGRRLEGLSKEQQAAKFVSLSMVDYSRLSEAQMVARDALTPFAVWAFATAQNYNMMLRASVGLEGLERVGSAWKGWLTLALPPLLMQIWNEVMHPGAEEKMTAYQRSNPKVVLVDNWKGSGKPLVFVMQYPPNIALAMSGLPNVMEVIPRWLDGLVCTFHPGVADKPVKYKSLAECFTDYFANEWADWKFARPYLTQIHPFIKSALAATGIMDRDPVTGKKIVPDTWADLSPGRKWDNYIGPYVYSQAAPAFANLSRGIDQGDIPDNWESISEVADGDGIIKGYAEIALEVSKTMALVLGGASFKKEGYGIYEVDSGQVLGVDLDRAALKRLGATGKAKDAERTRLKWEFMSAYADLKSRGDEKTQKKYEAVLAEIKDPMSPLDMDTVRGWLDDMDFMVQVQERVYKQILPGEVGKKEASRKQLEYMKRAQWLINDTKVAKKDLAYFMAQWAKVEKPEVIAELKRFLAMGSAKTQRMALTEAERLGVTDAIDNDYDTEGGAYAGEE